MLCGLVSAICCSLSGVFVRVVVAGVEEQEEDAAEGEFAAGGVVPLFEGVDAAAVPPAPMARAGMPSESGRLASVEPMRDSVLRLRWRSTARRLMASAESGGKRPATRSPMRRTVIRRVSRWRCASRVRPRRASALTHLESVARTRDSRLSSSLVEVERRSRSAVAEEGMELTEVPPEMVPQLRVVRGLEGRVSWVSW